MFAVISNKVSSEMGKCPWCGAHEVWEHFRGSIQLYACRSLISPKFQSQSEDCKYRIMEHDTLTDQEAEAMSHLRQSKVSSDAMNLEDFERTFLQLFDWARIWHRQAGGYMASDTLRLMTKCDAYAAALVKKYPDLAWIQDSRTTEHKALSLCGKESDEKE